MKKRVIISVLILIVISVSLYIGYAVTTPTPQEIYNITVSGAEHGNYTAEVHETHLQDATSGFLGKVIVNADPGYYVKNVSVTHKGNTLELGFEAGADTGNYLRKYDFSPLIDTYDFIIPTDATPEHKININIEFAEKAPFDINYMVYNSNNYSDESLSNPANYIDKGILVEGYKDGDLVLPQDLTDRGGVLVFGFDNEEDYNEYKGIDLDEDEERYQWYRSHPHEYIDASCDDESKTCYLVINKDFKNRAYGTFEIGYTKMNLFTEDYVGFSLETDITNFNDILHETDSETIGFTEDNREAHAEIFYGTRELRLTKKIAKPIVNDGLENNCGTLRDFDNVVGSGYGYSTAYSSGIATISIDTYYQDEITFELNILKNSNNVLGNSVKINLSRFAFAGNAGQLLEVDEIGRNCHEDNNGNTCNQGIYYSTQYRGILSFMYINKNTTAQEFDNDFYRVEEITDNSITVGDSYRESGYKRNADFNPHAIALFYDQNDMIVGTKDIDLNAEIDGEGFVKKSVFNNVFSSYQVNKTIDRDYVFFDFDHQTRIKSLEYFGNHKDDLIMHNVVIISKAEVEEKNIKKIGLFLVNGKPEENSIPALTYGMGQGRIMEIHGGEE